MDILVVGILISVRMDGRRYEGSEEGIVGSASEWNGIVEVRWGNDMVHTK
jgi:hypothetical protein